MLLICVVYLLFFVSKLFFRMNRVLSKPVSNMYCILLCCLVYSSKSRMSKNASIPTFVFFLRIKEAMTSSSLISVS